MKVDLAPWRPDVSQLNDAYASDVTNVLLGNGRYIPFPMLTAFTQAVSEQPLGGIAARVSGSVHIFVGTATMIWKFDAGTGGWTPVSEPGADTILTGNFSADTNWTKSTGVTISAGAAHFTAVAASGGLTQNQSITGGKIYKLTFTVLNYSAGGVTPRLGNGGTPAVGTTVTANGTYTQYITGNTGNLSLQFLASGTTTLDIDNVSMRELGTYGASVDERWRFRQFGDYVIAVNVNDDPQYYQIGVSTEFADVPDNPPNARNLAVWGDRVALFNGATVTWCDTDNIANWTTGTAGSQTFQDGGDIMFATDMTNPIVVQERAIRAGTFVPGSLVAYTFTKVHDQKGCVSPYAGASRGNLAFFADAGAFWQIDGDGTLTPIGFEKVDRTIFAILAARDAVYCEVDPRFQRAYFAVKINSSTDNFDLMLVYDWQIGEWTQIDIDVGILFPLAAGTTGLSLDDDGPDDVLLEDQGDVSLDSSIYQGGAPLMAAFLEDFTMGFFDGPALEATVTTQEAGSTDGTIVRVSDIMPIVDTSEVRISIGARNRRGDAIVYSAEGVPSTRSGICRMKSRARFHRFRVRILAAASWTAAQGIDVKTAPAGSM
jgi:hypothetical protein